MDFPVEEYRARLARVQAEMARHHLPVLLLHQPENVYYLSGFYTIGFFAYHSLAVPVEGDPVLVLRDVEEPLAVEQSWVSRRVTYADTTPNPLTAVKDALDALGLGGGVVGVEYHAWFLTLERYHGLAELLPHARFVREPRIVDTLRLIKSPREVAYIRAAARVVEDAMRAGIEAIVPGVRERDLALSVNAALVRGGAEWPFVGVITSGERTQWLHGQWSDRRVLLGDQVYYELDARVCKYHARLLRTTVLGEPTPEQQRTADVLIAAQDAAIHKMYPGVVAVEIDEACRGPVLRAGLRESYTNRVGYSIGIILPPSGAGTQILEFVPSAAWRLEAGMVFHMLLVARGIGISETVLVTDHGPELLTRFDRRLFVR